MIQSTDLKEFFDSLTNSKQNQNFNRGTKFTLFMVFCKTGFDNAKIMIHVIQSRKKEKIYRLLLARIWLFSQEFHCFCMSNFPVSMGNCIPTYCPGNLNDFCGSNGDNYLSNGVTDVMIYETGKKCSFHNLLKFKKDIKHII